MQAIASPDPVVLLIDEIDKTDQEFEAMLLELLSDFQITIPELGQISATTMPIVILTSNNSRELTEALKRRCLYLWLDYPELEREMEIVRLHAPDLSETLARRLVEVVRMVRGLDLKKPPSIAESIDWARTLLLMGADDIDHETFQQSMSIIVKHRTDIDLVAERVGLKMPGAPTARRHEPPRPTGRGPTPGRPGLAAKLLGFCEELRSEGVAVGTSEILDAFAALEQVPWTSQDDFREALAATIAKSQEDRRLFELLFERWFFRDGRGRGGRARDRRGRASGTRAPSASTSTSSAIRSARRSSRARTARCATWRGSRSPPSGARARARASSASTSSGSAAPSASRPGRNPPTRRAARRSRRSTATSSTASSATSAASSNAT